MALNKKITEAQLLDLFRPRGRIIPEGDRVPLGQRKRTDLTFRFAEVKHFEPRKQEISVQLYNGDGPAFNIPLTHPFVGTSSYIAGIPDEGSIVLLGYQDGSYFPLAYLPNLHAALDGKHVQLWDKRVRTADKNDFFYRFKRLNVGELALGAEKGGEIYLSDDVSLDNGKGDIFKIRSVDSSILSSSLNSFNFTAGVWKNSGLIYRNSLGSSNTDQGHFGVKEILTDGKDAFLLKNNDDVNISASYFTEYHVEVEDTSLKRHVENDINSRYGANPRNPIAIFTMGNFAGNNPNKKDTYGKLLGVSLFTGPDDVEGNFKFTSLTGEDPHKYGMAIMLYRPEPENYERGALFGIDKEGHFYQYIPSASAGGIGKGRSMSILALGSKKEVWGKDKTTGNAWDLVLKGGLKWAVGSHDARSSGLSMDIRTESGVFFIYGNNISTDVKDFSDDTKVVNDTRSYKKIEKIAGKERHETKNSRETIIGGAEYVQIAGMREESIGEAFSLSVGDKMIVTVNDTYFEKVNKEKNETFGNRKTTITAGKSELIMKALPYPAAIGTISEQIVGRGHRTLNMTNGNISETIWTKGNRNFRTNAGSIVNQITTKGDIVNKTGIGKVVLKTNIGSVEISGTTNVNIKTKGIVNISGTKINLKGKGLPGGAITSKSHLDYVVGAPLMRSFSVSATA